MVIRALCIDVQRLRAEYEMDWDEQVGSVNSNLATSSHDRLKSGATGKPSPSAETPAHQLCVLRPSTGSKMVVRFNSRGANAGRRAGEWQAFRPVSSVKGVSVLAMRQMHRNIRSRLAKSQPHPRFRGLWFSPCSRLSLQAGTQSPYSALAFGGINHDPVQVFTQLELAGKARVRTHVLRKV